MNEQQNHFEQNLGRLIKASFSPEAGVSPAARERLRLELAATLRRWRQPAEFPASALGLLTALVLLLFAGWGACPAGSTACLRSGPLLALMVVNLVGIPIASLVIVLRRRYA